MSSCQNNMCLLYSDIILLQSNPPPPPLPLFSKSFFSALQWARLLFGLCHSLSQSVILPSFFLFYFISFESSSKQKLCVRFTYFFSFLAAYYSRHHHHRHRPHYHHHRRFLLCAQSAVSSTTTFDIVPYAIFLK